MLCSVLADLSFLPVQWILRLWGYEEAINCVQDLPHGDVSRVVTIKYVVADSPNVVHIAVVHLCMQLLRSLAVWQHIRMPSEQL